MPKPLIDRDYGSSWKERLEAARARFKRPHRQRSEEEVAELLEAAATFDVSCAADSALFWSGKDILTGERLDESVDGSPLWWDKHAPLSAEVFRKLGLASSVEDTPCGQFILGLRLDPAPSDPFAVFLQEIWKTVSGRFAKAVRGRVEVIAEGSWEDGVFRDVEWSLLLQNPDVTHVNGLDRVHLPQQGEEAYSLLRRWEVERCRRYVEFLNGSPDATQHERDIALDDYRELECWYAMDLFSQLSPNRELPALPHSVQSATDATVGVRAWKYSQVWRDFVRSEATEQA